MSNEILTFSIVIIFLVLPLVVWIHFLTDKIKEQQKRNRMADDGLLTQEQMNLLIAIVYSKKVEITKEEICAIIFEIGLATIIAIEGNTEIKEEIIDAKKRNKDLQVIFDFINYYYGIG